MPYGRATSRAHFRRSETATRSKKMTEGMEWKNLATQEDMRAARKPLSSFTLAN
eukprot:m.484916 g.484916  ORF g.484916 m.484916 type:complete len:54 (-) comp71114_c0_seq1:58-219(-)